MSGQTHQSAGGLRGWVRVEESQGRFVLAWYESERQEAVGDDCLDAVTRDSPAEALSWARERAPVVVVARFARDGRYGDFSAGLRPPRWAPDLAILDEDAMLARQVAPWPDVGEFAWVRTGPGDQAPADIAHRDRVDWAAIPEIKVTGVVGAADERVQRVVGGLSAAPTETELRVGLAREGIDAGDNHLLDADGCEHVLYPLLDFADRRRVLGYLLMQVSSAGIIHELEVIDIRLTLTF